MFSKILYNILKLYSHSPWWMIYGTSDIMYPLFYHIIRYRRGLVKLNLANAFPELNSKERKEIEHKFYHHLCDTFVETIKLLDISEEEIKERVVFTNPEVLSDILKSGRSAMTIGGHYGNWEWESAFGLYVPDGTDFFPLYKPLHDPNMDKLMFEIRSHFGGQPIHKKEMLRKIITSRKNGRNQLMAFIGDQRPRKAVSHLWTTFLNQDTAVFPGAEKIVELFDMASLYAWVEKPSRGHYRITFIPLYESGKDIGPNELSLRHTAELEKNIRFNPSIWLWSHSRWKYKKPTE